MRHSLSTKTEPGLAGEPTCRQCAHRLRRGTCAEPVAAGLAQWFEIHWPPAGHAATCPAFSAASHLEFQPAGEPLSPARQACIPGDSAGHDPQLASRGPVDGPRTPHTPTLSPDAGRVRATARPGQQHQPEAQAHDH